MSRRRGWRELSRRERLLVGLLGWTVLLALAGTLGLREWGRSAEARERAAILERQVRLLAAKAPEAEGLPARLERVRRALEEERRRFYTPEEMDPYRFGTLIRNRLVARGLVIDRYQTLSAGKETLLEFSVQGDARALVSFFREVSQADHYWSVPYVTLSAKGEKGSVQSVFRILYERNDEAAD